MRPSGPAITAAEVVAVVAAVEEEVVVVVGAMVDIPRLPSFVPVLSSPSPSLSLTTEIPDLSARLLSSLSLPLFFGGCSASYNPACPISTQQQRSVVFDIFDFYILSSAINREVNRNFAHRPHFFFKRSLFNFGMCSYA